MPPSEDNVVSRRLQGFLTKIEQSGAHADAVDCALNLVNPFPDYPMRRVGWPDMKAAASVVFVDTYETTIKQPSGLSAGDTWDAHISMLPVAWKGLTGQAGVKPWLAGVPGTSSAAPFGVYTAATGQDLNPVNHPIAVEAALYDYGDLAQGAPFRVVAMGAEVVNVSPSLYKGGSSFAYRYESPVQFSAPITTQAPSGTLSTNNAYDLTLMPPGRVNEIINWPNTYAGEGDNGLYIINAPIDKDNPVKILRGRDVAYFDEPNGSAPDGRYALNSGGHVGWCTAGGFMTGLAQGSSLLVKFRVAIEIFPVGNNASDSKSLVRLSNLTVPSDPVIMYTLSQLLREMPAGCPYTENPLGEWIEGLFEKASKIAPVLGNALSFIPGAKLVGDGIGMAASAAHGLTKSIRGASAPNEVVVQTTKTKRKVSPMPKPNAKRVAAARRKKAVR